MTDDFRRDLHALADDSPGNALPVDALLSRVHRQRFARTTAFSLAGVGAAAALVLGGITVANHWQSSPFVPIAGPSPTTSSAPSPTPTPTPVATPTPTATTTAETPGELGFTLGSDGSIGDLPLNAPEADVIAYLDARLGPHEVADPTTACAITGDPGRLLAWGGLFVPILTEVMTSPGDPGPPTYAPAPPYAGGWNLTDADLGLRTGEGLGVGDTVATMQATYPTMPGQLSWVPGLWIWSEGHLQVLTDGGTATDHVAQIAAGSICPLD